MDLLQTFVDSSFRVAVSRNKEDGVEQSKCSYLFRLNMELRQGICRINIKNNEISEKPSIWSDNYPEGKWQ